MKLQLICGSPRSISQSENVSRYLAGLLDARTDVSHEFTRVADLVRNDPRYFELEANEALDATAKEASGFIFVTPEYSGMVPPAAKQWFFKVDNASLAHKPILIVGVSGGVGGTYPITEIRSAATKNTRLVCVPEHVIVRNANDDFFAEGNTDKGVEEAVRRLTLGIDVLVAYAEGLTETRQHVMKDGGTFYGM